MGKRFDGYIRVSRVAGRSGDRFISPDEQRSQIEKWAGLRGVEIVAWHTDLDQTGGKLTRPGLDALMARVRARETDGLAVAYLDRLSRAGVGDALRLITDIYEAGGEIAIVELGIDPTTPFGEFGMTIMLALARMQRRQIAEKWDAARRRAVARGVHIASRPPTGYRPDPDTGRLIPHPQDGPVITELFRRKAMGASWGDLIGLLDDRGVVGPYGASQWTSRAVSHIIANRVYLGEARSGEYTNADAHPALVDRATWEAAQRTEAFPAHRTEPALLAGLLRCAGCRHLLKPDKQTMRTGDRVRIYRCRGRHAGGTCEARAMVLGSVVEPYVVERVFARLEGIVLERTNIDREYTEIKQAADDADAALAAYRDDTRILTLLGPDRYVDGLAPLVEQADRAAATLAAYLASVTPSEVGDVRALRDAWPDLDTLRRQRVLRAVVDAVFLRSVGQANVPVADRTLIFWRGQAPPGLPARGRRTIVEPLEWPPSGAGVHLAEDVSEDPLGS